MAAQFETQWNQCLGIIREALKDDASFQDYFASVRALAFQDHKLKLLVPSYYVYEKLESDQYFDLLKKTLRRVFGPDVQLTYNVAVVNGSDGQQKTDNYFITLKTIHKSKNYPK